MAEFTKLRSRVREPKDAQFATPPAQEEGEAVVFDRPLGVNEGKAGVGYQEQIAHATQRFVNFLRRKGEPKVTLTTGGKMFDRFLPDFPAFASHVMVLGTGLPDIGVKGAAQYRTFTKKNG